MKFAWSLLLAAIPLLSQTPAKPVRGGVTDPGVVTTRQSITPAGVPTIFQGKVWGVAFGASASDLWVLTAGQLYEMDWRQNKIKTNINHKAQPGLMGVSFANGKPLLSASVVRKTGLFTVKDGALAPVAENIGAYNAGSIGVGSGVAIVPLPFDNKAAVVDLATGTVRGHIATEFVPFAAVVNAEGTIAYVSNWGGRKALPNDKTAPTGLDPNADRLVVNAAGFAASGTVTRVDLTTMKATHSIAADLHPNGLAWDEKAARLYVANNNRDSVTVIDTARNAVLRTHVLKPFA
ncbi:MAG: hypothetical protein FJW32_29650, partial [Acidobacteria bacterium]|nr:hypothetical protein [Acidobacteriota bacterium]